MGPYTWWHGLGLGFTGSITPRSWQGHLNVTGRSNQLQIGENSLFLCCFNSAHLRCLWWLRLTWTPAWKYNRSTPRGYRGNIRARGVIPHQITLMSPLSHMAEIDKITQRLSCLDQWPVGLLHTHWMNPKPKYTWWHGLGVGLDRGVTPRSQQGHLKVTEGLVRFK